MAAITAQRVLDENNYTVSDIPLANLEYLIDNAIDHINSITGLSMSNLTGLPESKTVTLTSAQAYVVKLLSALMIRAYKDRGPNVNIGALGVTTIIADPQYRLFTKIIDRSISALRSPPIYVSKDPVPT